MMSNPPMKSISRFFPPTNNRRLNELIGFLLCVSALLLFLALASYSPLDPSFNSASALTGSHAARNWIGLVGAVIADLMLQFWGVGAFLIPVFAIGLGMRWFRSRRVMSPIAKSLGGIWLLIFVPALLALLPGHARWMGLIPVEGLLGRVVGDALIHYFNAAGAYIVCATVLAVALYLSTAFSFSSLQGWVPTRFAFAIALWDKWKDWRQVRAKKKMQRELGRRRAARPVVSGQPQYERVPFSSQPRAPVRTGIERMAVDHEEIDEELLPAPAPAIGPGLATTTPEATERADSGLKAKTTMPRIA